MNRIFYIVRQLSYTVFSFAYFLCLAAEMTIRGFFLITLGGATEEHKRKYHSILQRKAQFIVNNMPGATFSFSNESQEDFSQPAMIVCNHQSHIDLMAVMSLTPNLIILTKNWVWHNPFYGLVIRYADFFPISDTEEMAKNLEEMVKKGYSIVIYPEGTRSEDCKILPFHRGAFYMAEQLNLDIVPVFIEGFGKVLPKTSYHLHPGHLAINVKKRIKRDDPMWEGGYRNMTKRMRAAYREWNHEPPIRR